MFLKSSWVSTNFQNLDKVIETLRRMGDYRNYGDSEEVARLKSSIDLMRQVEFALTRDLERLTRKDRYFFAEDSEAPTDYRKLVEEYYKAIAKGEPQ